ncbi:MAG: sigma-54 interaction domain-containing protein [Ignavibacteriaceae bacterium]
MQSLSGHKNEILNSLAEGVFTVDKEFRINFFNKAAEKITGFKGSEVIGKTCKDVFKSNLCQTKCPFVQILESGKTIFDIDSQIFCNGKSKSIRLNAAILKNELTQPIGGVISFRELEPFIRVQEILSKNYYFYGIVGFSKAMNEICDLIIEIADCDASVLIQGETGTGKELIADAIHAVGRRKDKPFIKVNCAVIPPNLLASELFGHVKGAFTDASKDRTGRFELANNGTIFLDEIAEMPANMQSQLLRVLQNGKFERLGESISRNVDVRIISATNNNINSSIEEGKFREDLFFRLNVIPIRVPPLRERKDDILFLVTHFLNKFSLIYKKNIEKISDEALDIFMRYNWPGNVRELENAIEFAFIRTKSNDTIHACKLPPSLKEYKNCSKELSKSDVKSLKINEMIKLLEEHKWNKSALARELGVDRTTIWRQLKKMGIDK